MSESLESLIACGTKLWLDSIDPELVKRTLAYATSAEIRSQDAPILIRLLMQRPWASTATWDHLKGNWDRVERAFGIFQGIPAVVASMEHLCDAASKNEVERFFSARSVDGIDRTLRQSLERIDRCTATRSAQAKNLAAFLAAAAASP